MRKAPVSRDCRGVTGADLRIARQEQGGPTRDPLNDSELAPNAVKGSIPSLIVGIEPKLPGTAATVSLFEWIFPVSGLGRQTVPVEGNSMKALPHCPITAT